MMALTEFLVLINFVKGLISSACRHMYKCHIFISRLRVNLGTFSKTLFDFISYFIILEDNMQLQVVLVSKLGLYIHLLKYPK